MTTTTNSDDVDDKNADSHATTTTSPLLTVYGGVSSEHVLRIQLNEETGEVLDRELVENVANRYGQKRGLGPDCVATEWVATHPSLPLLYAMTNFWAEGHASIVTYEILPSSKLRRLGETSTASYQACHAIFLPRKGRYCLAIAHYIGGAVSIFDCGTTVAPLAERPLNLLTMPDFENRNYDPAAGRRFRHLGSLAHGLAATPDNRFLIVCDAGQSTLFCFHIPTILVPTNDDDKLKPVSHLRLSMGEDRIRTLGLARHILPSLSPRPRHVAIHPSGKLIFVLYELFPVVAWHAISTAEDSITIGPELGQASTVRPDYFERRRQSVFFWNATATIPAEIAFNDPYLYVSNRGLSPFAKNPHKSWWGHCESSISVFRLIHDAPLTDAQNDMTGVRLEPVSSNHVQETTAMPRHFLLLPPLSPPHGSTSNAISQVLVGSRQFGVLQLYRHIPGEAADTDAENGVGNAPLKLQWETSVDPPFRTGTTRSTEIDAKVAADGVSSGKPNEICCVAIFKGGN